MFFVNLDYPRLCSRPGCGVQENFHQVEMTARFGLKLCSACNTVAYCSRECQIQHWKQSHKAACRGIQAWLEAVTTGERPDFRSVPTSVNPDGRGSNWEADRLVNQAFAHKEAYRLDQSLYLYIRAIQMDPYNHLYYHYRGTVLFKISDHFVRNGTCAYHMLFYDFAVLDAQSALDLHPYVGEAWMTLVRASIQLSNFDKAGEYLDMALNYAPISDYVRGKLIVYKNELEDIQMNASTEVPIKINSSCDPGDQIYYLYTMGQHHHGGQPELLLMDVESSRQSRFDAAKMLKDVSSLFLAGTMDFLLGDVHQVPCGHDIHVKLLAIPVDTTVLDSPEETTEMRRKIKCFMGMAQAKAKMIVLRIYYPSPAGGNNVDGPPEELSKAEAKEMLRNLAQNFRNLREFCAGGVSFFTASRQN